MGPSIILDKSAVESIGQEALRVQSQYFYTVITPILVWEICGDIQKSREGKCDEAKVRALADKAYPFDSIVTTDWRKLCAAELSGLSFEMGNGPARRALVDGAHRVPLESGGHGVVIDNQPEALALLRWGHGKWSDSDRAYSQEWRRITKAINLDDLKRRFGPARQPVESVEKLKEIVGRVLVDPSLQFFLLTLLVDELGLSPTTRSKILTSWAGGRASLWQSRSKYCRHCIRTFLTFYLAVGSGLIGTNPTNRVDLEYLLYLPFAPIFVSGDLRSHGVLAPLLIDDDQTFVKAADFRNALVAEANRQSELRAREPKPNADEFEPPDDSLIRQLWIKAWGYFRKPPSQRKPVPDDLPTAKSLRMELNRAMDFVESHPEKYSKRPPWPRL